MDKLGLLYECLPYLRTLLNLSICKVQPCMSTEEEHRLKKLIDDIWILVKEYQEGDF